MRAIQHKATVATELHTRATQSSQRQELDYTSRQNLKRAWRRQGSYYPTATCDGYLEPKSKTPLQHNYLIPNSNTTHSCKQRRKQRCRQNPSRAGGHVQAAVTVTESGHVDLARWRPASSQATCMLWHRAAVKAQIRMKAKRELSLDQWSYIRIGSEAVGQHRFVYCNSCTSVPLQPAALPLCTRTLCTYKAYQGPKACAPWCYLVRPSPAEYISCVHCIVCRRQQQHTVLLYAPVHTSALPSWPPIGLSGYNVPARICPCAYMWSRMHPAACSNTCALLSLQEPLPNTIRPCCVTMTA